MKATVNLNQILQGGLAGLVAWLFKTVNDLQQEVAVVNGADQVLLRSHGSSYERTRTSNAAITEYCQTWWELKGEICLKKSISKILGSVA